MIKKFNHIINILPEVNPTKLEESVKIVQQFDKVFNSGDNKFIVNLDLKTKFWYLTSPFIEELFGNKTRYGKINRFRANPVDAINAIFSLFKSSHLSNFYWVCRECNIQNISQKITFDSKIIEFDYRVECRDCKSYHYNRKISNRLVTNTKRPISGKWK